MGRVRTIFPSISACLTSCLVLQETLEPTARMAWWISWACIQPMCLTAVSISENHQLIRPWDAKRWETISWIILFVAQKQNNKVDDFGFVIYTYILYIPFYISTISKIETVALLFQLLQKIQ